MSWPAPTRADHEKFCHAEGWTLVRRATGAKVRHHLTFELPLSDGRILRTRISRPPDRSTYGRGLWSHILRDQLDVTEDEFWACVQDGARPRRSDQDQPREGLPAEVVHLLVTRVGLSEAEVAAMSKPDAVARLTRYWAETD